MKRPWDAIAWWEIRRIPYNLAVLVAGIVSIAVLAFIGPDEDIGSPLLGIIFYGFMANVCYTLGWVTELIWDGVITTRTKEMRRKVFRVGLLFSVGLTLLPALLLPILWLVRRHT
jgi:hypothetical protein